MSDTFLKRATNEWRMDSIGVAVFVVLTAIAYFIEFEPAMRDRDALSAGSAALAEKRDTIAKLQSTIHTINGQIQAQQTAQANELKLQPPAQINDRLSTLSTLATDHGLTVEAIEPGEGTTAVRYSTVPIRINGRGKYPQVARFIHALRTELPDTAVTDISIAGGGGDTAPTVTLNLLWYAAPTPVVAKNDMQ